MKTSVEIKKGLEYLSITNVAQKVEAAKRGLPYAYAEDIASDALAYIRELEAKMPKWISVEERLPEPDVDVLVCARGKNEGPVIEITDYTHHLHGFNITGWHAPWQYFNHEYKITHWMPLPELPEEEA